MNLIRKHQNPLVYTVCGFWITKIILFPCWLPHTLLGYFLAAYFNKWTTWQQNSIIFTQMHNIKQTNSSIFIYITRNTYNNKNVSYFLIVWKFSTKYYKICNSWECQNHVMLVVSVLEWNYYDVDIFHWERDGDFPTISSESILNSGAIWSGSTSGKPY
jgi:hypothetical protein